VTQVAGRSAELDSSDDDWNVVVMVIT